MYGSHAKEGFSGDDIDLLVISDRLKLTDKLDILVELKMLLGEQKIELVIGPAQSEHTDAFIAQILPEAVRL